MIHWNPTEIMLNTRFKKPFALVLTALITLSPLAALHAKNAPAIDMPEQSAELAYDRSQALAILEVIDRLKRGHYSNVKIDDNMSSRLLDAYLKRLDPAHNIFLKSDIEEFEVYRNALDDKLMGGNPDAGFAIYNRYQKRLTDRLQKIVNELPQMIAAMDFSADEVMIVDRESLDWPANIADADEVWRKQLKASVLSLKLADKGMDAIEELLLKRYRNQLKRMSQVNSEDVFQLYMNAFTELFDPHTNYFSPRRAENFNMNMRLSLEGIGAVLQAEDEYTKVSRLVPAGPADKQGELRAADRIVAVGQEDGEMVDVIGWRLDEVVDLIRGPKGSTVRLELLRGKEANQERKTIAIVRDQVKLEEQAAQSQILDLYYDDALHRIGVIDIPAFYADFEAMRRGDPDFRSTTRDVARLLSELQEEGVEGIIIDLRENGGGSLAEANALTGLFIESGPTVQIRHSNSRVERKQKFRDGRYYEGPLTVLINRLSASASEIFAGAIQDYQRGLVVGSQSFGKGTVQSLQPLNHGQLKLTESKFYRISGESTQHRGVVPDIELPDLYDKDEVGESALDNALPWDTIAPVRHRRYGEYNGMIDTLRQRHDARISHDPDFAFLRAELELSAELDRRKTISLNEDRRREERSKREEQLLSLQNQRRVAKGLEPVDSLEALNEEDGDSANDEETDAESTDDTPVHQAFDEKMKAEDDIMLVEAGNILLDAIQLRERLASRD